MKTLTVPTLPRPGNPARFVAHWLRDLWRVSPWAIRISTTLWVAMLIGVAGRVAFSKPTSQTVVPIYLAAGERWLASEGLYRYSEFDPLDVYRNPPGVAVLFVPLSVLPEKLAAIAWRGFTATVFLIGLVRFRRNVAPEFSSTQSGWYYGISAILGITAFNNGQVNFLIAAACLHAAADMSRERWRCVAGWFAFAAWLKVYPLAVGLLAVAILPRQLGVRLAAYTAIGFAVPFLFQYPEYVASQYAEFVTSQMADDRTYADPMRVPRDWTVLPRSWLGWVSPPMVTKAVSVLAGLVVAGLTLGFARRYSDAVKRAAFVFVIGSIWMTLFGPATEMNTYSLLAVPAVFLAVRRTESRLVRVLSRVAVGLLLAAVLRAAFGQDWRFSLLGPQPFAAMLLLIATVWEAWFVRVRTHVEPVPSQVFSARVMGNRLSRMTKVLVKQ